jgi:hypothetical protein
MARWPVNGLASVDGLGGTIGVRSAKAMVKVHLVGDLESSLPMEVDVRARMCAVLERVG